MLRGSCGALRHAQRAYSPLSQRCIYQPALLRTQSTTLPTQTVRSQNHRRSWQSTRRITVEAGENKSGHIHAGPNEGIIFLDNIFPLRIQWMLRLPFFQRAKTYSQALEHLNSMPRGFPSPMSIIKQAIPKDLPIKVTHVFPRLKEGGVFVKFSHDGQLASEEIESSLRKYLKEHPIMPWWSPMRRVRTFLVRGKPWLEDLYRFPSTRLRVEYLPTEPGGEAAELSQETLYSIFRKYGKLADIATQPSESKVLPKYALLTFRRGYHAIMAKNCMHGFTLPAGEGGGKLGTVLKLGYEQKIKGHWIRDWLFNHPRIVIPILGILVGGISIAIFDPIRTFFIKAHITRQFHLNDNPLIKYLRSQLMRANDLANELLTFRRKHHSEKSLTAIWEDRQDDISQIQKWLMETADTFIVIQGPRGSGKKELVLDEALQGHKNRLLIDCKPIQEAHGDAATIKAAALEVGYRPVFSWMNSISSLVDLAAQGTIGTKTGFSETLDSQLDKIWQNTAAALKEIALDGRAQDDKDAALSADEYLDAHPEKRPVVVIDNFLHKSQENSLIYDKLAEWAAGLTTSNVAHVIFLTTDVSFSKSLSRALPDRVFRQISLGDCSPEVAKRFVMNHLYAESDDGGPRSGEKNIGANEKKSPSAVATPALPDLTELDSCISTLGGRLTDLEFLARRIKTGESPPDAIRAIIAQSASEILKMYLLDLDSSPSSPSTSTSPSSPPSRPWTPHQAWLLVKALAASPTSTIPYTSTMLSSSFSAAGSASKTGGGDTPLQSLAQADLIAITYSPSGRPEAIKAARPVYLAAFRKLVEDATLAARMDYEVLGLLVKEEERKIRVAEEELGVLRKLVGGSGGRGLEERGRALVGKIGVGQGRVERWEVEREMLKRGLGRGV